MTKAKLKEAQEIWYQKLADSGFVDIEVTGALLKGRKNKKAGIPDTRLLSIAEFESISEYYSMARIFLLDHEFKTDKQKVIWEYHSEGLSVREIVTAMKPLALPGTDKSSIHQVIKALETKMKAKYLAP